MKIGQIRNPKVFSFQKNAFDRFAVPITTETKRVSVPLRGSRETITGGIGMSRSSLRPLPDSHTQNPEA